MFGRVRARILPAALAALATTLSLHAAGSGSTALSDVLSRAASAAAVYADSGRRIVCRENDRQTVVMDPVRYAFDPPYGLLQWAYRDVVASWSVMVPASHQSGPWTERLEVESLETFQSFPGKRALPRASTAAIDQTIDVPAPLPRLAAAFLSAGNQPRFEFSKAGEKEVDGTRAWEVSFRETATSSLWRLPIGGSFWIDPSTGRLVQSAIAVRGEAPFSDAITVDYRLDPATGFYFASRAEAPHSRHE
jgi:hypothetical protein